MGTVIHPKFGLYFTNKEIQVLDVFENVIRSYPIDEPDSIFEANRFIEEWEQRHADT